MLIVGEEYRVVSIIIAEYVIDILVFLSLVFHYFNYTNVFYYYAKAILLDNLDNFL